MYGRIEYGDKTEFVIVFYQIQGVPPEFIQSVVFCVKRDNHIVLYKMFL